MNVSPLYRPKAYAWLAGLAFATASLLAQVAAFFAHYSMPLPELQALMMKARDSSADAVVAAYYAANKPRFAAMFDPAAQTASATQP